MGISNIYLKKHLNFNVPNFSLNIKISVILEVKYKILVTIFLVFRIIVLKILNLLFKIC